MKKMLHLIFITLIFLAVNGNAQSLDCKHDPKADINLSPAANGRINPEKNSNINPKIQLEYQSPSQ